jgi:hypothetical protein
MTLLAAEFPRAYLFRPAYIYPVEPRKKPNFSYAYYAETTPRFRALFPSQVIRAEDLARRRRTLLSVEQVIAVA